MSDIEAPRFHWLSKEAHVDVVEGLGIKSGGVFGLGQYYGYDSVACPEDNSLCSSGSDTNWMLGTSYLWQIGAAGGWS